ncbi:MAG: RDD family protein [Planctomycetes bacterium]|nr:RDD family protein [Planctomycetota bacterium]
MADSDTGGLPGTAQCEITGKWVPEDELITLHGKRVCAEGKAELLDRLKGGETLPGEMESPTVMQRFSCMFVDNILMTVFGFLMGVLFGTGFGFMAGATAMSTSMALLQLVAGSAVPLAYYTGLHGRWGQTAGKRSGKLKVVRLDGSDISYYTAFVRFLWFQGPAIVAGIVSVFAVMASSDSMLAAVGILGFVSVIYHLINVLVALRDRDRQRAIHDRMSGTRVIRLA